MSVFDSLRKQVLGAVVAHVGGDTGAADAAVHPGLFDGVVGLIRDRGLASLAESLKNGGLSEAVGSWVGHGVNLPVSADQLRNALGPETVEALARKAGLPAGEASALLAKFLPGLVDKLTPDGVLDETRAAALAAAPADAPASDWDAPPTAG